MLDFVELVHLALPRKHIVFDAVFTAHPYQCLLVIYNDLVAFRLHHNWLRVLLSLSFHEFDIFLGVKDSSQLFLTVLAFPACLCKLYVLHSPGFILSESLGALVVGELFSLFRIITLFLQFFLKVR